MFKAYYGRLGKFIQIKKFDLFVTTLDSIDNSGVRDAPDYVFRRLDHHEFKDHQVFDIRDRRRLQPRGAKS